VTSKRSYGSGIGRASEPESPSTLRSIDAADAVSPDSEDPLHPVYCEAQPLVAVSDHKTIEIETIKLADDIDPRKLPTELRLSRPTSVHPPDSNWPQTDAVVVSSHPPSIGRRRWQAPILLLVLLGALLALVLARGAAERSQAAAPSAAPTGAVASAVEVVAPSPTPAFTAPAVPEPALVVAPAMSAAEAIATATPPLGASEPRSQKHGNSSPNAAKPLSVTGLDATPGTSGRLLAAPSVSKPKRAIY
jgi:hypothetical protein